MNTDWILFAANAVLVIVMALFGWVMSRYGKTQERLHKRLDDNDEETEALTLDVAQLKEQSKHFPTSDSIGRLHDKVNEVGLNVARVEGGQVVMSDLLSRLLGSDKIR